MRMYTPVLQMFLPADISERNASRVDFSSQISFAFVLLRLRPKSEAKSLTTRSHGEHPQLSRQKIHHLDGTLETQNETEQLVCESEAKQKWPQSGLSQLTLDSVLHKTGCP